MWDERLAEVCRRHPDLVAVYESSRGRLALLLRQTLVPLSAEQVSWLAETRAVARAVSEDLRAAGFRCGVVVLQWLPAADVARIVARWVRRFDGDATRRSQLLAVVERKLADQRFLASRGRAAREAAAEPAPAVVLDPQPPRRVSGFDQAGLDALKAWYETMAPCWLAIQPARRRRLVLQTHVWLADRALTDPVNGPERALSELGPQGSLARALERLVPPGEAAAWRSWIEYVRRDLARALARAPELRTQAWARWLFFVPYGAPPPRRVPRRAPRRSPRPPASAWTAKPWREKMSV
jgi:hypothetical protein